MTRLVEIKNLSVSYVEEEVLKDVNMEINKHDFLGIIGPNGGGKTTFIKALLGLLKPDAGEITFHIPTTKIGYLPQINQVDKRFPIKVLDVVRSGKTEKQNFSILKKKKEEILYAEKLLAEMGVLHLRNKLLVSFQEAKCNVYFYAVH